MAHSQSFSSDHFIKKSRFFFGSVRILIYGCTTYYWPDMERRLHRVMKVIMKIWVPCPRNTDNSIPFLGGRKTSPCTCFQPDSSWASSCGRDAGSKSERGTVEEVPMQQVITNHQVLTLPLICIFKKRKSR